MARTCTHLAQVRVVAASVAGCEECLAVGMRWVHLRQCLVCGHAGCCDASEGMHATKHFLQTLHPVMRSLEPGEAWGWCYVDRVAFDLAPARR